MKRRILDDDNGTNTSRAEVGGGISSTLSTAIEKLPLASGLFLYRYHVSAYPPNVQEHDQLTRFLGRLIPKLMVATSTRMEPFICVDGRHLDDDFFTRLRESGMTWRPLLGFPVVPGIHPFRFLPIAYHIKGREAWNEAAERFLGTGGTTIYLTSLPVDEFLMRLIQSLFVRDTRGATNIHPVYLPEIVLEHLSKAASRAVNPMSECFQFFIGENPSARAVDIVSRSEIQDLLVALLDK
jgi:hypothetical protein